MAPIVYYMQYIVWFNNESDYDFARGLGGDSLTLQIPPDTIAGIFGLLPFPGYPSGDVSDDPVSISFTSVWNPGSQLMFPGPTGVFLNAFDPTFYVTCQPGVPASIWPCPADDSHDALFIWEAVWHLNHGAGIATNPPPAPQNIPQRRWIDGAEDGEFLDGGLTLSSQARSIDASRVTGGKGFTWRGTATSTSLEHLINQYRTGLVTNVSWERFYFRARRQSTLTNAQIWRCSNTIQPTDGCFLRWATTGEIRIIDVTGFSVERDQGIVFTPTIGQWYKIDVFLKFGDGLGGTDGRVRIFVDTVETKFYSISDGNGMDLGGNHRASLLGGAGFGAGVDIEFDMDDWVCADLPANVDPVTLVATGDFPIDFLIGSHIRTQPTNPNTGSSTNWTGNRGVFNQGETPSTRLNNSLVSTTALARLEGITDVFPLNELDTQFVTIGVAAAIIGLFSSNSANTDGQLGYRLAGGGDVLTTIDQISSIVSRSVSYLPTGNQVPVEISPFHLVHTKSNDGNTDTTGALVTTCEYIGVWGSEDDPAFESLGPSYIHNSPYFNSLWGFYGGGSQSPVYAVAFTYAGNSAYQEFSLPAPAHFIKIRNINTVGSGGLNWFSSSQGAVLGDRDRVVPNLRVWTDPVTSECFMSVSGSDGDVNQTGQNYQVIVFCDPGMRFCLNAQFQHGPNSTVPFPNPLLFTNFTPECAFASEQQLSSVSNNAGLSFKGPANSGDTGNIVSGNSLANWGTLSAGFINSRGDLHAGLSQSYSVWRSTEPGCTGTMVQILQYTGNAVNPRNIALTPTSGRFPIFVTVIPSNSTQGAFRDPSHAGANSSRWGGAITALAITAVGLDQITINSDLNANGVTYSVFAICGDVAGMNQGEFTNLYCSLPTGGPFIPPTEFVPGPNVIGDGGLVLNGASPLTLLKDISGIYTLVPGLKHDVLMDRQTGQTSVTTAIPDPTFKTGYIGG